MFFVVVCFATNGVACSVCKSPGAAVYSAVPGTVCESSELSTAVFMAVLSGLRRPVAALQSRLLCCQKSHKHPGLDRRLVARFCAAVLIMLASGTVDLS